VSRDRRRPSDSGAELEVDIEDLGAAGDGIAASEAGRIFVPLTVPGERWRVRLERRVPQGWQATPLVRLVEGPRATPPCPHFGRCGGCRLQHLPPELYAAHKRQRILDALAHRGLAQDVVGELLVTPPASRRRLRLGLARVGGSLVLGYRRRGSHRIEPIQVCPIACAELVVAIPPLAQALGDALAAPDPTEVSLTLTAAGVDLLLHAGRSPRLIERECLAALADRLDLAQVSWATADDATPEPIVTRRRPMVRLGTVPVEPPPGAFLQASGFADAALAGAVEEWSQGSRHAVDLFAGIGTLTFALARTVGRVRAVEGDAASVEALRRAAADARLAGVSVERRDLARRPLTAGELKGCDLVVLDPPRGGAAEQVRQLASAPIAQVIYVSCSPESFARDARVLVDGGLTLAAMRPIDQFLYAAEVELAARFVREPAAKRP
jgi:23S rRNA (uracil1939-C5)-methyltransferase